MREADRGGHASGKRWSAVVLSLLLTHVEANSTKMRHEARDSRYWGLYYQEAPGGGRTGPESSRVPPEYPCVRRRSWESGFAVPDSRIGGGFK